LTRVIFDTSFLLAVVERPTTWFEDIAEKTGKLEPVVLQCVLAELARLASGQGRKSRVARVAVEIAEEFSLTPCNGTKTDEEIISAALTMKAAVATTDRELVRFLLASHIQVFGLRSGRVALL